MKVWFLIGGLIVFGLAVGYFISKMMKPTVPPPPPPGTPATPTTPRPWPSWADGKLFVALGVIIISYWLLEGWDFSNFPNWMLAIFAGIAIYIALRWPGHALLVGVIYVIIWFLWFRLKNHPDSAGKNPTSIVVWRLDYPVVGDSSVVYTGPCPWEKVANYPIRITPECGKTVSVYSKGWDHQVILTGCNNGTGNLPAWDWGEKVKISAVK